MDKKIKVIIVTMLTSLLILCIAVLLLNTSTRSRNRCCASSFPNHRAHIDEFAISRF